jgi:pyroglutamyl-peptidase
MKTVLLTGFEPFGGEKVNASAEVARRLHGAVIGGHRVQAAILPCVFGAAITGLKRQIHAVRPELVVCLGQAAGRAEITPERVALNVDDARIPDNAGRQPVDRPVVRGGPAAHWSTLPIKAIVRALQARGIPAAVSQTAGTFVCNHVFYGLMHALRRQRRVRGGFIHLPVLPTQARRGRPGLALAVAVTGVRTAVAVALRTRRDRRSGGGTTH